MVDRNHDHDEHEHEHEEHDHDDHDHDHEGHDHSSHDHGDHEHDHDHEEHDGHDHDGHDHSSHSHDDHDHDHDDHDHSEHVRELANGEVEVNLHEEGALIASGTLGLSGVDVDDISARLANALANVAKNIEDAGGLIGHLKASVTESTVRMLSTTAVETEVSVLLSPQSGISINVILIAFMVEESDMLKWGQEVMASLQ
jgi:hypothetical protein